MQSKSAQIASDLERKDRLGDAAEFKERFAKADEKKKVRWDIAKYLIDKHHIKTISDGSGRSREVYVYQDGVYRMDLSILKRDIQQILEELTTNHEINETVEAIKNLTLVDREVFDAPLYLVNLANGVLNLNEMRLSPHDPEYPFLFKLPISYDPDAKCLLIKRFLEEILNENDIPIVEEMFGHCLYRRYLDKKAIICVGEKDTGKTTFINLLQKFVGENNVSSISLQRLSNDKFAAVNLHQKHLNCVDDMSNKDVVDTGSFKMMTGESVVPAEYKFGASFSFKNFAKLVFACNAIPSVKEVDDSAYFSRWVVLKFEKQIPVNKTDRKLVDKLTQPNELSGLLNMSLDGLKRLSKNKVFSYPYSPEKIKEFMLRSGDPVAAFIYDNLEDQDDQWISKDEMHEAYVEYASKKKLAIVDKVIFGKKMSRYGVRSGKCQDNKGWRGKSFRDQLLTKEEEVMLDEVDKFKADKEIKVEGLFDSRDGQDG